MTPQISSVATVEVFQLGRVAALSGRGAPRCQNLQVQVASCSSIREVASVFWFGGLMGMWMACRRGLYQEMLFEAGHTVSQKVTSPEQGAVHIPGHVFSLESWAKHGGGDWTLTENTRDISLAVSWGILRLRSFKMHPSAISFVEGQRPRCLCLPFGPFGPYVYNRLCFSDGGAETIQQAMCSIWSTNNEAKRHS